MYIVMWEHTNTSNATFLADFLVLRKAWLYTLLAAKCVDSAVMNNQIKQVMWKKLLYILNMLDDEAV